MWALARVIHTKGPSMKRSSLILIVGLFLLAGNGVAVEAPKNLRRWEHESSDIPVNSRIHFGHFENGLRYAWIKNPEPDQRCYLRLHVDAGSLGETETEQGMAHFLEHMAFNGTKNFPAGTLIEWFQRHGMGFGADTNAVTSFGETIYMIDLPTADQTSLAEGLQILRDFADGILLEKKEVEAEKGVIDGEEREGDSAQRRVLIETLERRYDGTRYAVRLPIGTKERRDAFTSESIASFYRRWYRPENMTLVVAGDLEDLDPTGLIRAAFGEMPRPEEAWVPEPNIGEPTLKDMDFFLHEEEIPVAVITIDRLVPYEDKPVTVANWLEDLPLSYARSMLNLRFSEKAKEEGAPFINAGVGGGTEFEVFDGESLSITAKPEMWKEAITVCEQELRRALRFGFRESELEEVRADALRGLDESVAREPTRSSLSYVSDILAAAESRSVATDAETRRKIFRPAIEALDVKACHAALVKAWNEGTLALAGMGKLDLGEEGGKALREVYDRSRKVEVKALDVAEEKDWAYGSDPEKRGEIASRSRVEDLDFERIAFKNGVFLNLKKTDFREQQILVSGRFGEGRLSLEKERAVLAFVGTRAFGQGGLGAHSQDEIRRLTAGKLVGVSFSAGEDAFSLGGGTTSKDLGMQFEMLCGYLRDPGWRDEGLRQFQKIVPQYYESLKHQHQGPLQQKFLPKMYSGDPRFGLPEQEDVMAVTMKEIQGWISPDLMSSPLEVTVVGDLDVKEVVAAASATLGRLPERGASEDHAKNKKVPAMKTGLREEYTIQTAVPKSLVFLVFPTDDGIEAERRRNLGFLGTVLNDRLRIEVREKLGAAYSPGAGSISSQTYPGDGMIFIQAMSDPDKVATLEKACLDAAQSLAEKGVTEEEVDRLKQPVLAQLRDSLRTNGYWLAALSEAQGRPESLDDVRTVTESYEKLEAKSLSVLAKKYLAKARASILIVSPEGGTGSTEEQE